MLLTFVTDQRRNNSNNVFMVSTHGGKKHSNICVLALHMYKEKGH
jgi:hypothetical protein